MRTEEHSYHQQKYKPNVNLKAIGNISSATEQSLISPTKILLRPSRTSYLKEEVNGTLRRCFDRNSYRLIWKLYAVKTELKN